MSVGRFKRIKSFKGAIAELFVFFHPLSNLEVEEHYQDGQNELENGDGQFLQKILDKDEADFNRKTFASEKKVPDEILKQVDVSPEFFKTVQEEPEDKELNERDQENMEEIENEENAMEDEEIMQNLNVFILENPMIADQIEQLAHNYEWLLSVSSIMVTNDINKDGAIELSRFMKILKFSKIKIPKAVISEMVDITKTGIEILDDDDDHVKYKGVLYYYFLKIIKQVIYADMLSHLADEDIEKVSIGTYEDSDDNIEELEPEQEEEEEEKEEVPPAASKRKDSFRSSPDKFEKVKNHDVEYEDEDSQRENPDKTLDPVMPAEGEGDTHKILKPTKTLKDDYSVNEEGLIKNKEQDENFKIPEPDPEPEPTEEEEEVILENNSLPDMDHEWNSGPFEVNIIRCSDCHKHFDYSRHSEDEYINAFNDLGNEINEKFGAAIIIGNHERPGYLGCFDVYVRGVGPIGKRDSQGRYFIFRKNLAGRMPKAKELIDTLTILCLLYGNAEKLGKAQKEYKQMYADLIPKPSREIHDLPADMPESIKKQPNLVKMPKPSTDRVMVCKNWGCGQEYSEEKNEKKSCTHHPGRYQFGSRHGLWPESWTCCRSEWDSLGCRKGFHRGVPKDEFTRLCINHGEPNPTSFYPDSFCGRPFKVGEKKPEWQVTEEDKEALQQCQIHPGYLKIDKRAGIEEWTCCNEGPEAEPCSTTEHIYAEFPDEEAKKYFYNKPLVKIGNYEKDNRMASEFELYGKYCGVFLESKPYIEKNPPEKPHISRDDQKKLDKLEKVCLNWACGKIYKEEDVHKKSCRCHTGCWDFGTFVNFHDFRAFKFYFRSNIYCF